MACIIDPIGDNEEKLLAPFEGIVIGSLSLPLAHKGDAIFHLASAESRQELEGISDMVIAETLMNN